MLFILQIIFSILLILSIVLQASGSGLSGAFGGSGEFYRSKRSLEKLLIKITIVLSILFAITSIALLFSH